MSGTRYSSAGGQGRKGGGRGSAFCGSAVVKVDLDAQWRAGRQAIQWRSHMLSPPTSLFAVGLCCAVPYGAYTGTAIRYLIWDNDIYDRQPYSNTRNDIFSSLQDN